jgi:cytochrome P450/NADPH-cytochrome P450 reductase
MHEKRFTKMVGGALREIRNGVPDGLFTAYPGEHNLEVARRVLMPGMQQHAQCLPLVGRY